MIVLYILLAIIILLLMVVIHEFGHYIAGKLIKFKINEFSVGFGPKIVSKKKKNGEVFSLRLIPLGGYCAFEGESETSEDTTMRDPIFVDESVENKNDAAKDASVRSFNDEKPWKRIIVLLAGGVFNLISAVIFSFLFIAIVGYATPKVAERYVNPDTGTVYCEALSDGDEIIAVNGKKIDLYHSFNEYTSQLKEGDSVVVTVVRDGKKHNIDLKFQKIQAEMDGKKEEYTGFGFKSENKYNRNLGQAFIQCVPFTAKLSWSILGSFFQLITGKLSIRAISGPIGTVSAMAEVAQMDWRNVFLLLPLIASNLGLFNLLPIPALDGSKVIFTTIEWIRKKPINRKVEGYIHTVGIILLLAFVVIVDVINLILRFV